MYQVQSHRKTKFQDILFDEIALRVGMIKSLFAIEIKF